MRAAVDDVHHRNRQFVGVAAANVAIQGETKQIGSSFCGSKADAEDSVSTEFGFGRRAVELDHLVIESTLIEDAIADERGSNDLIDVRNSFERAFAEVATFVAVAELESFILAGGCAGRNGCATDHAALENDIDFDSRIAARIKNLTTDNFCDLGSAFHFTHRIIPLSIETKTKR